MGGEKGVEDRGVRQSGKEERSGEGARAGGWRASNTFGAPLLFLLIATLPLLRPPGLYAHSCRGWGAYFPPPTSLANPSTRNPPSLSLRGVHKVRGVAKHK